MAGDEWIYLLLNASSAEIINQVGAVLQPKLQKIQLVWHDWQTPSIELTNKVIFWQYKVTDINKSKEILQKDLPYGKQIMIYRK